MGINRFTIEDSLEKGLDKKSQNELEKMKSWVTKEWQQWNNKAETSTDFMGNEIKKDSSFGELLNSWRLSYNKLKHQRQESRKIVIRQTQKNTQQVRPQSTIQTATKAPKAPKVIETKNTKTEEKTNNIASFIQEANNYEKEVTEKKEKTIIALSKKLITAQEDNLTSKEIKLITKTIKKISSLNDEDDIKHELAKIVDLFIVNKSKKYRKIIKNGLRDNNSIENYTSVIEGIKRKNKIIEDVKVKKETKQMAQTNITAQATTATIPVESASTTKTPANPTTIPPAKQKKSPEINNLNLLFNSKKLIELNKTISENGLNLDLTSFLNSYSNYIETNLSDFKYKDKLIKIIQIKAEKLIDIINERIAWVDEQIEEGDYESIDRPKEIKNQRWIINEKLNDLFSDFDNKVLPTALVLSKNINTNGLEDIENLNSMFDSELTDNGDFDQSIWEGLIDYSTNTWHTIDLDNKDHAAYLKTHGIGKGEKNSLLSEEDIEAETTATYTFFGLLALQVGLEFTPIGWTAGAAIDAADIFSDEDTLIKIARATPWVSDDYRMEKTWVDNAFATLGLIPGVTILTKGTKLGEWFHRLSPAEGKKFLEIMDKIAEKSGWNNEYTNIVKEKLFGIPKSKFQKQMEGSTNWRKTKSKFQKQVEGSTNWRKARTTPIEKIRFDEDIILKNKGLNHADRITKASILLNKELSPIETAEILKIHSFETENIMDKYHLLRKNFSRKESITLLRSGICGKIDDFDILISELINKKEKIITNVKKYNNSRKKILELEKKLQEAQKTTINGMKVRPKKDVIDNMKKELDNAKKLRKNYLAKQKKELKKIKTEISEIEKQRDLFKAENDKIVEEVENLKKARKSSKTSETTESTKASETVGSGVRTAENMKNITEKVMTEIDKKFFIGLNKELNKLKIGDTIHLENISIKKSKNGIINENYEITIGTKTFSGKNMTDITKIIKKEQTEVTDRLMELRKIQNEEILKTATKFEKNNTEISDGFKFYENGKFTNKASEIIDFKDLPDNIKIKTLEKILGIKGLDNFINDIVSNPNLVDYKGSAGSITKTMVCNNFWKNFQKFIIKGGSENVGKIIGDTYFVKKANNWSNKKVRSIYNPAKYANGAYMLSRGILKNINNHLSPTATLQALGKADGGKQITKSLLIGDKDASMKKIIAFYGLMGAGTYTLSDKDDTNTDIGLDYAANTLLMSHLSAPYIGYELYEAYEEYNN